jgi:cytochrome c
MEVNGLLVMSTGQQWPYATTIFDFVRRAMPHPTAKSLSNNQVYAITGYILYLNDLVGEQDLIDKNNLPQIEMPAFKRFVHAQ